VSFRESDVTLVVLAGGDGSRMGRAKGALLIGGVPILRILLRRWNWRGPTMLVTAPGREHPSGFEDFDREVCDPASGAGPLRGLLTALEPLQTPLMVCTAVDMPAIEREQLIWISDALSAHPKLSGMMCRRQRGEERTVEPFPSAYRKEAKQAVKGWMEQGRRSMHSLLELEGFGSVTPPVWEDSVWTNLNFPEEFERYCSTFGGARIERGNQP
jgi:molybdopterin-guanine dinucleotide biosynthesis protein A